MKNSLADLSEKVLAVTGPTASGKSALAVYLAKKFDAEIISADSMQIYRGLDIGTAKVTADEADGIRHFGIDILEPNEAFSVSDFVKMASDAIADITSRGKRVIICGGTGLYLQSLLDGVRFSQSGSDESIRAKLEAQAKEFGNQYLHDELSRIDPEAAAAIHPNNTIRVIRALEHYYVSGMTISEQKRNSIPLQRPYEDLILGLRFANRTDMYNRINLRVDKMMDAGLLQEAESVYQNRNRYHTAAQAIGYKEFFPYFEQTASLEECVSKLKQASRNYAKRQMTWFNRMPGIQWFDAADGMLREQAAETARRFWMEEGN